MSWKPDLPRFPLLEGASPLHPMGRLSASLGDRVELWIKREDLLPLAFGGNKLRNLEFLVGEALAAGADTLVTSGRRWSNHCRLTAAAGARAGLEVHLVLTGPLPSGGSSGHRLDELLGATAHVTETSERTEREDRVARVEGQLRAAGGRPYVIGVGGSGVTGAVGQVLAGIEVADQAAAAAVTFDTVVLPSATGGTQAGLTVGLALASAPTRVRGVAVAQPLDVLEPAVARTLAGLADLTGTRVGEDAVEFDARWLAPGYGRRSDAADEATRLLARTEGLLVDPIYTAKALAALVDAVRTGSLDGRRVLFWHAGGLPGLFEPLDD